MYESHKNITINQIIEILEKQGIINIGDSNSETGEVKTQPDGYVFQIKEKVNDWEVTYIGTGDITPVEIVIILTQSTKGITNEVIITMTAKAESGITSYTLPKGTPQSVESGTKEITQTVTVTENGTYVFTVVNGNGQEVTKSIKIDNILKDVIQMSASPSEYTYDNVVVTITWPERSNQAIKQVKIGEGVWQTVTGTTTQITLTQNTTVEAKVQNSVADIVSNTLIVANKLQSGVIPISTEEQLLKIGTGEVVEIDGKSYAFGTSNTYELKNDFEFIGDYRETASRIKENVIPIKGNGYKIIVTTAEGVKEYYTANSKYYIATNKYGYVLDGLQAYYDGIDNTGTGVHSTTATVWKDLSGNGRDGVLTNFGMNAISGWGKDNLSFDGVNDWVNCGELNSDYMTIDVLYLRKSEANVSASIVGNWQNGGAGICTVYQELSVKGFKNGVYHESRVALPDKYSMQTVTMVSDEYSLANYINGEKKTTSEAKGNIQSPENETVMGIGGNPYATDISIDNGDIDVFSVRIYDRALTEEEVEINSKSDERRYKNQKIIPVYTAEQVEKIGSGESVYVEAESKTYNYASGAMYEYKNDIEITTNYIDIIEKLNKGEIFIKLNEKVLKNGEKYYTSNSKYSIAVNKYGYVTENLELLLDGIDNTGNGHSNTTETWKDLSGNNRDGTLKNTIATSAWVENGMKFDGEDDYVLIAQMNYDNITIEAVLSQNEIDDVDRTIIGNQDAGGYFLYKGGNNRIGINCYIEEENAYVNVPWNSFTVTKLAVNTKYSTSSTFSGKRITQRVMSRYEFKDVEGTIKSPLNNTYTVLGANPTGTNIDESGLKGTIYSARIYSRALTEEEQSVNYLADIERYGL